MRPGYESDFCKDSYVGSPVKAIAHPCPVCKKGPGKCHCKHKGCHPVPPMGICQAVVDDVNGKVYLYGNIVHENYHVPGNACIAYTAVEGAGFVLDGRRGADEFFEGEQSDQTVTISHEPIRDNSFLVFLNGVKQMEGAERDYTVEGRKIHFNFYEILPTDRIEVMYEYGAE